MSRNNLACPVLGFPLQDAQFGRDVTHPDNSDGNAGFSLTKLGAAGKVLSNAATSWSCVRDNVTGLVWENKTDDGGLHDKDWTYTWYNSTSNYGTPNGGLCYPAGHCDTEKFVSDVNATNLCGRKNWRLPSHSELIGIVDYSKT